MDVIWFPNPCHAAWQARLRKTMYETQLQKVHGNFYAAGILA